MGSSVVLKNIQHDKKGIERLLVYSFLHKTYVVGTHWKCLQGSHMLEKYLNIKSLKVLEKYICLETECWKTTLGA